MSRPLRIEFEGAWYHVMNRGRARQTIFPGTAAYRAFLQTLAEAAERFRVEVHAYCLMPNHYHLLLHTPHANLARTMRHINGLYTQRHNRLKGIDGPLFRGRYKAILVDADQYLLSVSRYIHRNPIETKRPLVSTLADWSWSSYPAYINQAKAPEWLHRESTYVALGPRARYRGYQHFVESPDDDRVADFYRRQRRRPVLGDDSFERRVRKRQRAGPETARAETKRYYDIDTVVAQVSGQWGATKEAILSRGVRGGSPNVARAVAMWLCQQYTEATLPVLAERFGGIHYSAVGQAIRRVKQQIETDPALRRKVKTVKSRLDP